MSGTLVENARLLPIERLRQADWNANRVPPRTLAKIRHSIETFGVVENLVARPHPEHEGDFEVVSGNHRLELLRELGVVEVPVVVVDVDEAHARILAQTLNRTRGADDPEAYARLLERVLEEMSREDALSFLPETDASLERALGQLRTRDLGDADDAPALRTGEAESKEGEVYELGPHRLLCGDATKLDHLALLMGEERAQAVITDPPYGVDYGGKNAFLNAGGNGAGRISREIANDALEGDAFVAFLTDALAGAAAYASAGAAIYVWHADAQGLAFRIALERAGWLHKQTLVWVKNAFVVGRQDYQWKHEPVLYGWKSGAPHRWFGDYAQPTVLDEEIDPRSLSKAELVRLVDRLRTSENSDVLREPRPTSSDLHPTMKPVALLEHFLWNSTERGEIVLDPFAGSGSMLVAAEQAERRCFCLELDPHYCDVIRRRYEGFIGGRQT